MRRCSQKRKVSRGFELECGVDRAPITASPPWNGGQKGTSDVSSLPSSSVPPLRCLRVGTGRYLSNNLLPRILYLRSLAHCSLHLSLISNNTRNTMLTSTNMNPFAEWSTQSSDSSPSVFGALPSIPIAPTLPVFITDSLVLRFSSNNSILDCVLLGPQNRTLFSISSSGSRTSFRNVENAVFAVVDFASHATVEVQGFTPRKYVRDWLRLTSDQRYDTNLFSPRVSVTYTMIDSSRQLVLGNDACFWRPMGHHIVVSTVALRYGGCGLINLS